MSALLAACIEIDAVIRKLRELTVCLGQIDQLAGRVHEVPFGLPPTSAPAASTTSAKCVAPGAAGTGGSASAKPLNAMRTKAAAKAEFRFTPPRQTAKKPTGRPKSSVVAEQHAALDQQVLGFLAAAGRELPSATVVRGLKLNQWKVKDALKRLRAAGRVRLNGTRTAARWEAVAAAPKSSKPTQNVNGADFDVVFTGAKGQSLIGDREQRK